MKKKKIFELLIGSNNAGKIKEIRELLPKKIKIFSANLYKLKSPKEISFWKNYNKVNTYNPEQFEIKKKIIRNFILKNKPKILCDMGCNDGEFSEISLKNGGEYVVGFENALRSLVDSS